MLKINKGNSGAKIFIINDKKLLVKKISPSIIYSNRLEKQHNKIKKFNQKCFKTPKIIKKGHDKKKFFYVMEYIYGKSLAENIIDNNYIKSKDIIKKIILQLLIYKKSVKNNEFINVNVFKDKIKKIEEKIFYKYKNNPIILKKFNQIKRKINYKFFEKIPISDYHGDFTLENILYSNSKNFYLIDFDSNEFNSFYFDISKLYQDFMGHWFMRSYNADSELKSENHIYILLNFYKKKLDDFLKINKINKNVIVELTKFNLIRTIPYTKNLKILDFTLNKILAIK